MENEAIKNKSLREELIEKFENKTDAIVPETESSQPQTDWFNPWWLFVRNPGGFGRLVYS